MPFWDLNTSLQKSNTLTSEGVNQTKLGIQGILEKKPKLQEPLNNGIDEVREEVNSLVTYIDEVKGLFD